MYVEIKLFTNNAFLKLKKRCTAISFLQFSITQIIVEINGKV